MQKITKVRGLHTLMVWALMGILLAAFYQEFFRKAIPCVLCYLQRAAMICVALSSLLQLRFGIHIRYYAIALLSAFFGASVALRHILLHLCPGFPIVRLSVLGLNLYTWSFLAFCSVMLAMIGLLALHEKSVETHLTVHAFEQSAFVLVFLTLLFHCVTILL